MSIWRVQVNMLGTFKDDRYLYIVMEYVIGGEFFTLLRKTRRFDNDAARFYAAQVTLIFEYLHGRNIIYRCAMLRFLLLCHFFLAADSAATFWFTACSARRRVFCLFSLGGERHWVSYTAFHRRSPSHWAPLTHD